jgi:hypothetical protein
MSSWRHPMLDIVVPAKELAGGSPQDRKDCTNVRTIFISSRYTPE